MSAAYNKGTGWHRRGQYEKTEQSVNRNHKKVGVMTCLHVPLMTYVSRHSWASIMRDMGNDILVISRGLGHEDIKTTQNAGILMRDFS